MLGNTGMFNTGLGPCHVILLDYVLVFLGAATLHISEHLLSHSSGYLIKFMDCKFGTIGDCLGVLVADVVHAGYKYMPLNVVNSNQLQVASYGHEHRREMIPVN